MLLYIDYTESDVVVGASETLAADGMQKRNLQPEY